MSDSPQEPLLPRVAAGEAEAFDALVDRYKSLIWWLARKWSGIDPEDAVQEIFVHLWKSADRYNPELSSEQTFIAMIARRRLIDIQRRASRRLDPDPLPEHDSIVGDRPEALEAAADVSLASAVMNEELSAKEREILKMSIHHGLSHSEIAGQLDMPLGTVKTYIRRALGRVRERLAEADSAGTLRQEPSR